MSDVNRAAIRSTKARALLGRPDQMARLVIEALDARSMTCERAASSRKLAGVRNTDAREALRTEALASALLAQFLERGVTANLLAAIAGSIKDGTS